MKRVCVGLVLAALKEGDLTWLVLKGKYIKAEVVQ